MTDMKPVDPHASDRALTTADLLAVRDGDPLDAGIATRIRADALSGEQIDRMRDIQAALRRLPDPPEASAELWAKIEARAAARARQRGDRWRKTWPLGLVASLGLLAGLFLAGKSDRQEVLQAARGNIVVLQQQSRLIETELMRTSRYAGTPSEQALMFRLADVDAQLASLAPGDSLEQMRQKEMLWQRRIELMQALQAVQPPAEPAVQYAVY